MDPPGNEKILTAAPPYQIGPLGNFYPPADSPLVNAGSRSYAEAGLAHYTTRVDQLKEMNDTANEMVDIGLHYVATTGPTSAQPKDSDVDGIPDYVEDADGDNDPDDVSEGRETSPTLAQTTPGTPDALNPIYDDVDLDGDGMVGRIEKALAKNPLVSDNLLTLTQVTEVAPGIFTFKVPISYSFLASIGSLTLRVDGEDPLLQGFEAVPDGTCLLGWNSTYEPPGQHCLAVELNLDLVTLRGTTTVKATPGPIFPFFSGNVMQFDEAYAQYDDNGAVLYARLPESSASYTIELLDPANPSAPPIRTISGTTLTGEIEEQWDMTYDDGITVFTGDEVDARFTVTLLNGISQTLIQRLFKVVRPVLPAPVGNF